MEKISVIETVSTINRGSGFSNNVMAYRLALILENSPPTPSLAPERDRLQVQDELRTTLTQKSQEIESYKQNLKNKYHQEYLQKFGVNQQSTVAEPNTPNRVDKLIENKKQHYIQKFLNIRQQKTNEVTVNQQPQKSHQNTPETQPKEVETNKTSLISAAINTVLTRGQDTEQGRVYDGIIYRLQLLAKEGIQRINIIRKQGQQGIAFSAYKDDGNEFKVTKDNLLPEEKSRIITFNQQQKPAPKVKDNQSRDTELNE